jgi:hypothetical protein
MHLKVIYVYGEEDKYSVKTDSCSMIWLESSWIGVIITADSFLDGERFCKIGKM